MRSPIALVVGICASRPWRAVVASLLIFAVAIVFAATHFTMSTDTAELISPDVNWRRQERTMERAFPQLTDVTLVIIDGATPELAEDGAARLAAVLGADHAHVRRVERPDGGDFLAREGLLFASRADVAQTTAALVKAQPLLGGLAADPSLRGVVGVLDTALDGVASGASTLADIDGPIRALTRSLDASIAGRPAFFSWQNLIGGSGNGSFAAPKRRLILIQTVLDHGALMPGEAANAAIVAHAQALGLDAAHGITVRLTGEVPLADEEFATLKENIGLVGIVMLGAMLLTLWFALRSPRLIAAIMVTIVIGLVVTTAVGLLAVGRLNLISVAFIPLFVGLGVDFGIQLCVRFNAERSDGAGEEDAMRAAAEVLGPSLLLAAGAVALGFVAFLPTAYIGIAELGVIAGLGMLIALAFTVTLLPALIMLVHPPRPRGEMGIAALAPADRWMAVHRRRVLGAFGVMTALSIVALPWVTFDFNPLHLRNPRAPAMAALADLMRDPDRNPNTIDVLAHDSAEATDLTRRIAALREVKQVASLDSFVPEDQAAKLALIDDAATLLDLTLNPFDVAPPPGDAELRTALIQGANRLRAVAAGGQDARQTADARRLADTFERLARATPAQRARADALLAKPLAVMLDQTRALLQSGPVTVATLPPELVRNWRAPDGRVRLQVFPSGDSNDAATMRAFRAAVARVTPAISGLPVATQAAGATVAKAFVQAGVIAFALVSLLLFAVLRDAREVLFTLAPVILSIFLTLGTCVLIGQPINFANIIAFPLLFGVGVAFHIYFVMAWRGGAGLNADGSGAGGLLQSSLARAVLFSACATGTAFGSLWLSAHPGTASMGKILMISLIWTLICALIFEPALLGPPRARVAGTDPPPDPTVGTTPIRPS